ncbi:alkaline-shock protein [Clostridia bacterium]|nr:alkaline-shock protein [Clostridia bacterium]
MSETVQNKGAVHIAEDVVASVAALAATEVDGVASLAAGVDISDFIGKKNLSKGVKLVITDGSVVVDVFLLVKYGAKVQDVARKVQTSVQGAVESMTGLEVTAVNVHVNGISFDKESKGK